MLINLANAVKNFHNPDLRGFLGLGWSCEMKLGGAEIKGL